MSLSKLGADDVSPETQNYKDKLASKDGQIAWQQAQLDRKSQEVAELTAALNEAHQKLGQEGTCVVRLREELVQCKEDLRNERNASRNVESSLDNANSKLKDKDIEIRDLEAALERLSGTTNDHNDRGKALEREKSVLESRIRELESENRQMRSTIAANSRRAPSRTSSAKFNDLKIMGLEKETEELREKLSKKENESDDLRTKLSQAQDQVLRLENDAQAKETRSKARVHEMQTLLQEREEELEHYKSQQGGSSDREEELLQRIEEDEAKITALEAMVAKSDDPRGLKEKLRSVERRLKVEVDKVANLEVQNANILQERDDAFTSIDNMQSELQILKNDAQEKQEEIDDLRLERNALMSAIIGPKEVQAPNGQTGTVKAVNELDVVHIEKLLNAIERLRGERDDLRRSLQFLEVEHKFSIEALERRLAETHAPNQPGMQLSTISSVSRSFHESKHFMAATYAILLLHSQTERERCEKLLSEAIRREQFSKSCAEAERERCTTFQEEIDDMACQMKKLQERIQDSEYRQEIMVHDLEAITRERDDLFSQLEAKDTDEEEMKTTQRALQDRLEEVEIQLDQVSRSLEVVESERDSLVLQVKNLASDLDMAKEDLADAESRYSDLQFHQLSTMTSSEVTQTLRKQIEELEGRVMRRTELVGIHQHDIHRLETNLRLQEERMAEMTMELETLGTQKEAMLEDCADARDARDEALARIELLEENLETLEFKLGRSERALNTMICLLLQTRVLHQESRIHIIKLTVELQGSQSIRWDMVRDQRQMVVAFALSQLQCNKVTTWAQKLLVEKDRLLCNLELANERIEEHESSSQQLAVRTSRSPSSTSFTATSPTQTGLNTPGKGKYSIEPLLSAVEMQEARKERERVIADLERETQHLRKELSGTVATLEQERVDKRILEDRHAEALDVAVREINELESRVQDLRKEVKQLSSSQECIQMEKEKVEQEFVALRNEFERSSAERVNVETSRHDLTITIERLTEDIRLLQEEREGFVQRMESQADAHLQQLNAQKAELQSKVDVSMRIAEDRVQEVEILSRELKQERQRFQEIDDKRASLMKDLEIVHSNFSAAQEDIIKLQSTIQLEEAALAKSEEEKVHLHEDMTNLEAQIQKSSSFTNSLQRQIRDGERALETLKKELSDTQGELSRAETTAKTAEINLEFQTAQFKRELSKLQDQLMGRHDLNEALVNLEERNNEMEELLKAKCAEIEENDDRALEMLKENKKLSTKVEALTRRAQNLQTKLAAAKAAAADIKLAAHAAPVPAKASSEPIEVAKTQNQLSRRRSLHQAADANASSTPTDKTGLTSKPQLSRAPLTSTAARPKTPVGPAPVFKLRTPEQLQRQGQHEKPAVSIVGVKRRAPDEFEVCESIPPQGFTVDSLPSRENDSTTPRVRRMFNNLQPGFTPIRNKAVISPKRQSATVLSTPLIQDVTNSPRNSVPFDAVQQSKRSWLGKIRGAAPQNVVRPASRQVFTSMTEAHKR